MSKLSNANPSAFKLYTNTDQALGPGYTKKANNLVTSYATGGATGHLPRPFLLQLPLEAQLGISSIPYPNGDRQMWCDLKAAASSSPGTQCQCAHSGIFAFCSLERLWPDNQANGNCGVFLIGFTTHKPQHTGQVGFLPPPVYWIQFVFFGLMY